MLDVLPRAVAGLAMIGLLAGGCDRASRTPRPAGTDGPPPPPSIVTETCAPPSQVRRLSAAELRRGIDDLFPGTDLVVGGFVADPRPAEFDNDANALSPTFLLVQQLHDVAKRASAYVLEHQSVVVGCDVAEPSCARGYAEDLAQRAFRRPLLAEERTDIADLVAADADGRVGLGLAVEYVLQSPGFTWRADTVVVNDEGRVRVDAISLASRLSFFLWGTGPDRALLDAAIAGQLVTDEQIAAQVNRLLDDPRAAAAVVGFHAQWLDFERLDRTVKADRDNFSAELRAGFAREQEELARARLVDNTSIGTFLTTRRGVVNRATADLYGVEVPADFPDDGGPLELPADRGGFLRRGGFLAAHAHPLHPSPIQRGVFVLRHLLCTDLGAPPADADVSPPVPGADDAVTNRQVVEQRTGAESCQGCHSMINPIGFAFEGYDTIGRRRSTDNGAVVDDSGNLFGDEFVGADGIVAALMAREDEVERCAVRKLLTRAWGSVDAGWQECLVNQVMSSSPSMGLRDLLFAVATDESFRKASIPDTATVGAVRP
ncbi:MAG TPA: DUF1592 domain-containing protein [Myxococcota bacterium]